MITFDGERQTTEANSFAFVFETYTMSHIDVTYLLTYLLSEYLNSKQL